MPHTKLQWETLIRHIAADSSQIIFTKHVLLRMKQRHITQAYVMEVLRRGVIRREPEQDIKTGDTLCRMERSIAGLQIGVVLALEDASANSGVVVTALKIGE